MKVGEYVRTWLRVITRSAAELNFKLLIAIAAIIWFSASGYMYFEIRAKPDLEWADAFWWSFVTMTTVGYGDFFPESQWGRFLIGIPTMVFGISILGYLLSAVAAYILESKSKELKGMKEIKLTNHVLLVHFSDSNRVIQIIGELQHHAATRGKPIVLIDNELDEIPLELAALGVKFVRGNPARQATLERANYSRATHAVVLSKDPKDVRSDDLNLAVSMTIEGLKSEIRTVVECVDSDSIEILRRTGCDSIVCASQFSSNLLVHELLDPGVQSVFDQLSQIQVGQQMYVIDITSMGEWQFAELDTWGKGQKLMMIGVKRGEEVHLNPAPDFALSGGDQAVLIADRRPDAIDTRA